MRTTIDLDDALLEEARQLSGIEERTSLLREALRALIQRESARRLARLGGSQPEMELPPHKSLHAAASDLRVAANPFDYAQAPARLAWLRASQARTVGV